MLPPSPASLREFARFIDVIKCSFDSHLQYAIPHAHNDISRVMLEFLFPLMETAFYINRAKT